MAIEISNLTELIAIENDPSADYILVNDIDGGGQSIDPLCPIVSSPLDLFTGTLDGQGYTLKNVNIDAVTTPVEPQPISALFYMLMAGEIRNIVLENIHVNHEVVNGALASIISGSISTDLGDVTLENIRIVNCSAIGDEETAPIASSASVNFGPATFRNIGVESTELISSDRTAGKFQCKSRFYITIIHDL